MQQYVIDALSLAMGEGGRVHNQDLKAFVEEVHDLPAGYLSTTGKWAFYNAPLKDEPMEQGILFVPDGEFWYLNPSRVHYLGWLRSTIRRHEPEQRRIGRSFRIKNYASYVPEEERQLIREAHKLYTELIGVWREEETAELERELVDA
jgi:hypothetical protein